MSDASVQKKKELNLDNKYIFLFQYSLTQPKHITPYNIQYKNVKEEKIQSSCTVEFAHNKVVMTMV